MRMTDSKTIKAGIAQIAPVWLNRDQTLEKMVDYTHQAGESGCQLLVFGEGILPGYPLWIEHTDGARFNADLQKEMYAHYLDQSVDIQGGHLEKLCKQARKHKMAVYSGCIEKQGHSVYCSLVFIKSDGQIGSVHRKLMPTYEERLVWAQGDGHGLQVHNIGAFTAGGLNCWENWMPLARTALYAQGENLHISVWPGSDHNTEDITRFIARENRCYVISACGIMPAEHLPDNLPVSTEMAQVDRPFLTNGGSCVAAPDGEWVIAPVIEKEILLTAELSYENVAKERLLFDPTGHYSRKDVLSLQVNRTRNSGINFSDS